VPVRELSRRKFLFVAGGAALSLAFTAKHGHQREVRVRDHGARGDGHRDDTDAIQAAHDRARSLGGGVVRLDRGVYRTSRPLVWASGVSLVGAGSTASVLRPVEVTGSVITSDRAYSTDDPFRSARFERFGIDGAAMPPAPYDTARKGIFIDHMVDVVFRDLTIQDVPATGLGIDFLRRVLVDRVTVRRCGRGYRPGAGGGAGIGIGTGATPVEDVTVRRCRATDCGSHGIFFEHQPGMPYLPTGVRVLDSVATGNGQHGILDSGCRGMTVQGSTSQRNGKSGFACGQSELGTPGLDGEVRDSLFADNHEHGVILAATKNDGASGYRVVGNRARGNGGTGLQLDALTAPLTKISVVDNEVADNGSAGIAVTGASGGTTFVVRGNHLVANGRRDRGPAIQLTNDVENVQIEGNWFSDGQTTPSQGPAIHVAPGATIRDGLLAADHAGRNPGGGIAVQGRLVNVNQRP
jgi:hypothetical protein